MLTAKSEDTDKVLGLNVGADDYITKPFNPVEVIARVKSQLRRYTQLGGAPRAKENNDIYVVGGIELNDATKEVLADGRPVCLTPTEYDILKLFSRTRHGPCRRGRYTAGFGTTSLTGRRAPWPCTYAIIREKIEINPAEPRYLRVVGAQGYNLPEDRKMNKLLSSLGAKICAVILFITTCTCH